MKWLELAAWSIALIAVTYNYYYNKKFTKEEGMDERGDIIIGLSSRTSFSYLSMLISLLIISDVFLQFPLHIYKILIAVILILSNVASIVSLNRFRKNY
ncbi:hypothetical protein [Paenibacillus sp. J2TS4]|uniref:hypothetical protein n=1 Tax=Paenibacillus sp. J2TS4 TaxID=2807194 RepID=UPI001B297796|nr:hypothetical protein [Paenibacillus sp. J2TS4]GIP33512.1 hypothetical protein J2TS4_27220 [Paenibacillus sp. J2TS4]